MRAGFPSPRSTYPPVLRTLARASPLRWLPRRLSWLAGGIGREPLEKRINPALTDAQITPLRVRFSVRTTDI